MAHLTENILTITLGLPLLGVMLLLCISPKQDRLLKTVALNIACLTFTSSLVILGFFQKSVGTFQFVTTCLWFPELNINLVLGVDGISLFFILLTTLIIPLCILASWNLKIQVKEFLIAFLVLDFLLVGAFCVLDLMLFFIFFESVLIPMFFIIGIWGSRERKIRAAYYFFIFTFFGSVLMLVSIIFIYATLGTTDYAIVKNFHWEPYEQKIMWITFFIGFASKIPMIPFHLWLPEAHVEAPTSGSVVLAGVLLKLGVYGFVRFAIPIFPKASLYFSPLVYTLAIVSVVYCSFTAIRQTDFKRVIAYSSIAHMNLVVLGLFSFTNLGVEGALLQCLSHGLVASALFLVVGVVYDRYETRIIQYYGGLAIVMPVYVNVFFFFTAANMSFPGTSGFVGELLILMGSFKVNTIATFLGATSSLIGAVYSLWLFNRIAFGNLKTQSTKKFSDINLREFIIFLPLITLTLLVGLCPEIFLSYMHMSVSHFLEQISAADFVKVPKSYAELYVFD